ncbi:MAG: FAD-dependent oxidoreductase [bacterium]|nr:FAD-dependent oxidoreductase [bacterium]
MLYDVIIIGAGPAGVAAAIYAARKKLKILLVTESFGGQSIVSDDIQNWIGETHISGFDLARKLEAHVRSFSDAVEVAIKERAKSVREIVCNDAGRVCDFEVETESGKKFQTKSIIITAGARRKKLGVSGEDRLSGKGVAYCSTCDAPLFSDKMVAVIGGGNAGLESVIDLFPYAAGIYLLEYGEQLKGDPVTQEEMKKNPKLKEIIFNAQILEILGDKFVGGLKYKDKKTGKEEILDVEGVFVEIGSVPNSEIVEDLVKLDKWGQVIIDSKYASTSHAGVFAAGDITDDPFKQNNVSVGDGVKAALSAYAYLLNLSRQSPAEEK